MVKTLFTKLFLTSSLKPHLFLLRALLWLPFLLITWYLLAPWLCWPALKLAQWLLPLGLPNLIESTLIQDHYLMINTYLGTNTSAELPRGFARFSNDFMTSTNLFPFLLTVPIDSLKYAYGWPILVALTLATPSTWQKKSKTIGLGFLLVCVIQVWGVYFSTANFFITVLRPELASQAKALWPLLNESYMQSFFALGYRLGFLILPVGLPILLWAQQNASFVQQLIHGNAAQVPKPSTH